MSNKIKYIFKKIDIGKVYYKIKKGNYLII